ncbi:hypothetical protein O3M35_013227 [Rhynocoris fuscipes]|uniref:FGF n=1 Tax=Rhynocoris fuscipes TaxID=488301 RepID=A0AAW1CEU8_9HEMI
MLQREFTDECVFNEMIEEHHYNTYSSAKYSNTRRTLYLGMNKRGQPRRVQIRGGSLLGKLSTYTRVLTQSVEPSEVEAAKHGKTVCLPLPPATTSSPSERPVRPRCRMRQRRPRRRKKKRPCINKEGEPPRIPLYRRKCEEGDEECLLRRLLIGRKRKSRLELPNVGGNNVRHRKHRTAVRLKEEEDDEHEEHDDEDDDEDVTMTADDEIILDEQTDLFMYNNDNE